MLRRIRRLPSPALIVASVALVFAIAGGIGYAASKINGKNIRSQSIGAGKLKDHTLTGRQIKSQSVPGGKLTLNSVTGTRINESTLGQVPSAAHADSATNATNATNAANATNANTAANATGLNGPLGSGKTLTGVFATAGHKVNAGDFVDESPITFQLPLSSAPTFNDLAPGASSTACPGSSSAPTATPGNLCLYETIRTGATGVTQVSPLELRRFGAAIFPTGVGAATNYEVDGVWAVTAP